MELTGKEAHCIARLIQGACFGKNVLDGCAFCKYQCMPKGSKHMMCTELKQRFMKETGVDLSDTISRDVLYAEFPYKKFLKNSNPMIKEYFKNVFSDI